MRDAGSLQFPSERGLATLDVRSGGATQTIFRDKIWMCTAKREYWRETFRWESGAEVHEGKINYTWNSAGAQLLQILTGLARQPEHVDLIHGHEVRPMGLNERLVQFESDMNRSLCRSRSASCPCLDQIEVISTSWTSPASGLVPRRTYPPPGLVIY